MSLKWHYASESRELGLAEVADVCELLSMLKPKHRDALWGLLVVVTGAVAFQVGRRSQDKAAEPKREAKAAAGAEASARRLATQKARLQRALVSCRADLKGCQDQGWSMVGRFVSGQGQPEAPSPATAKDESSTALSANSKELRALLFRRVQAGWLKQRKQIKKALIAATTEQGIADEIQRRVRSHGQRFGLSDAAEEQLSRRYTALWEEHRDRMASDIKAGDYREMVANAKRFWKAEDRLVEDVLGPSRQQDYRRAERATRIGLIALLSTLGGMSVDDSLQGM